ncbi:unnamed protein product [Ostreobium quekettii]|uniref:Uncharacterized protein n=1 Tax=Ostreobium quekettii TaxID=121088 RepID=A0A8S1JF80_9CHLO|nr:unnamed protein product [Ostreobium quekettii]|eukprot:evm.model.scf_1606.4 EVM.evm.TU.scf_1606.4   scf_1606:24670-28188(-)
MPATLLSFGSGSPAWLSEPASSIRRRAGAQGGGRHSTRVRAIFGGNDEEGKSKNPFSNFSELLKTAKEAQARAAVEAQRAQEELSSVVFEGYDEEETVKVVVSGNQEPRAVELTQDALDQGTEVLQTRLVEAMQDAHSKSVLGMKDRMKRLYEDLGFPMPPQM